jgi:hypothetical protein
MKGFWGSIWTLLTTDTTITEPNKALEALFSRPFLTPAAAASPDMPSLEAPFFYPSGIAPHGAGQPAMPVVCRS